jgi:hypothetical protein
LAVVKSVVQVFLSANTCPSAVKIPSVRTTCLRRPRLRLR